MKRRVFGLLLVSAVIGTPSWAAAACWVPVPAANSIVFNTTQAGAPFQGQFAQFGGKVCLDQPRAQDNYIQVQVQTASVDTGLPELDEALRGPDFFDVARWPQASFASQSIQLQTPGHYQVTGILTLRDVSRKITVPFSLASMPNGGARLEGKLDFERLDFHIGLGQWQDTRWVGDKVGVKFLVILAPAREPGKDGQMSRPRVFRGELTWN
jgi:polyisoprenoid-binding protein YceI